MWMRPCMFFGRLQQTLLLLHLSHYSRSLGAYSCVGHDFIRTMLFFWLPQYVVCLCVCVWVFCCCGFFLFLGGHTACLVFSPHYLHSMHIAVFHLVHSSACVWDVLSSLTQINSTGALLGCDWVCTWSLWWLLYISFCESFKCCLQKGRIKHVLSTKGFTSADFEKKILLRTDLSYALNIIRWVEFRENLHLIFSVIPFDVTAVCGSIGPKLGTEIFTT